MKIAQPSYLMAPNLPRSSLFAFKGFVSILMLWSPTDICARILHHVSLLWSLLLLESAAPHLAIISLGTYWVYQNLVQVAMPDGNVRVLEITFSHIPLQHPAVTLWACSTEAFSMEIYHHRYWNILQISHKVFGDGLGFPVSSGISNHKVISCVRCSMWQVILLTESRNDPHNIWGCTTVPDDGFLQAKFIAPFQLPQLNPWIRKNKTFLLFTNASLNSLDVAYSLVLLILLCLQSSIITEPQKSPSKYSCFHLAKQHRCFSSTLSVLLFYLLPPQHLEFTLYGPVESQVFQNI